MKKYIMLLLFLVSTFFTYSQKSVVEGIREYKDIKEKMYISSVVEVEGKTRKDLMNSFKNWASSKFVNLKEVIVSETDDQIVLVYITSVPRTTKVLLTTNTDYWKLYVRLIVEFKDNKARLSFYDDGNVATPSSYYNGVTLPGQASRAYYMSEIYNSLIKMESEPGYKKPENDKEFNKLKNSNYKFMMSYQDDLENTLSSASEGLKSSIISDVKRKDDF